MIQNNNNILKVFISYSRVDSDILNRLKIYFTPLEKNHNIKFWYDGLIEAGNDWDRTIRHELSTANIVIALLSADFIASEYCENEMKNAVLLHKSGKARVIPILVRDCFFDYSVFAELQVLPKNAKPILSKDWTNLDEPLMLIAREIREIAIAIRVSDKLLKKQVIEDSDRKKIQNFYNGLLNECKIFLENRNWERAIEFLNRAKEHYQIGFVPTKQELNHYIKYCNNEVEYEKEFEIALTAYRRKDFRSAFIGFDRALNLNESKQLREMLAICKQEIEKEDLLVVDNVSMGNNTNFFTVNQLDDVTIITFTVNNLVSLVALDIKRRFAKLKQEKIENVILDFYNVDYIDSNGINVLLQSLNLWGKNEILPIINVKDNLNNVLKLNRLNSIFPVHININDAVKQYKNIPDGKECV